MRAGTGLRASRFAGYQSEFAMRQDHAELIRPQDTEKAAPGALSAPHILSEIVASLAAEEQPDSLLPRFLGTVVRLACASGGAVRLVTQDGESMRLVGSYGLPAEVLEQERTVAADCGVCGAARGARRVEWTNDLRSCARDTACAFFGAECRRVLAVPIDFRGRTLGVYTLFFAADRDIPSELSQVLRLTGELLGLALENARLTRENLRATLMNERQMLANEIHDSLAQTLHFVKMRVSSLEDALGRSETERSAGYAAEIGEAVRAAYASLRELLTHFRSRMDPQGLLHALQEAGERFSARSGVSLEFASRWTQLDLAPDQEIHVFHIVQEALANIGKHSQARHARLTLDRREGYYEVMVEDDGAGLHVASEGIAQAPPAQKSIDSFGMSIMRERAKHLGGAVDIDSIPGHGTRVRLRFPAREPARGSEP